jgi:hypothetical protein
MAKYIRAPAVFSQLTFLGNLFSRVLQPLSSVLGKEFMNVRSMDLEAL